MMTTSSHARLSPSLRTDPATATSSLLLPPSAFPVAVPVVACNAKVESRVHNLANISVGKTDRRTYHRRRRHIHFSSIHTTTAMLPRTPTPALQILHPSLSSRY